MKLKNIVIILMMPFCANAEPRKEKHEHHNYIIERQQAYQVQGVPTSRLIIGKREIDIYPDGKMFEKNNLVGIKESR